MPWANFDRKRLSATSRLTNTPFKVPASPNLGTTSITKRYSEPQTPLLGISHSEKKESSKRLSEPRIPIQQVKHEICTSKSTKGFSSFAFSLNNATKRISDPTTPQPRTSISFQQNKHEICTPKSVKPSFVFSSNSARPRKAVFPIDEFRSFRHSSFTLPVKKPYTVPQMTQNVFNQATEENPSTNKIHRRSDSGNLEQKLKDKIRNRKSEQAIVKLHKSEDDDKSRDTGETHFLESVFSESSFSSWGIRIIEIGQDRKIAIHKSRSTNQKGTRYIAITESPLTSETISSKTLLAGFKKI
ncbi:hypothetical protein Ddc_03018 [Ditylenchus destructor]|nr:hypothetical protein Ddc_03018 [Ditylenchus destructor]